jgi:cytochrome c biogenesis protein CcmG/thiol:disulfide interchange protein DsbE
MSKANSAQHAILVAPFLIIITVLSLCWIGLYRDSGEKQNDSRVFHADNVAIEGLDGQPLVWQQSSKPCTILHVWASWCPACQQDHAKLLALRAQTACQIVGIINKDSQDAALGYLGDKRNPYDALGEASPQGVVALAVTTVPLTLLLDAQGNLIRRQEGQIDNSFLEAHYRLMEQEA